MERLIRRPATLLCLACLVFLFAFANAALHAQAPQAATPARSNALPAVRTGADIYSAACATCHGKDGKGAPQHLLGFDAIPRDFTDCTTTGEPTPDWFAVVHEGGPIRALAPQMPAFGDALTPEDITSVVGYLRTFCSDLPKWPLGDLNFPRAFFTEKAFPESETVWTTTFGTKGDRSVGNELIYERRFGARNQIEIILPFDFHADSAASAPWIGGVGDVAVAYKRTFLGNSRTGSIAAFGGEVALPTGDEARGLGNGYAIYEAFAMFDQALPRNSYLQIHGGIEFPSDSELGSKEAYLRTAIGTTFAQNRGFGRAWSPQVELLWARPFGEASEYDIVPQVQVSLSKLQHVLIAGGVRLPLTQRDERKPQVLVYFLWDWFDGGLFSFWK